MRFATLRAELRRYPRLTGCFAVTMSAGLGTVLPQLIDLARSAL